MNEKTQTAKVEVEKGKTIETGAQAGQVMPANPSKEGYSFKEWNSAADGTGETFTAQTPVTDNLTVYAIFTKNPVKPANKPSDTPSKPVTSTKPSNVAVPKTGDTTSGAVLAVLAATGAATLAVAVKRKDV